MLNAWFIVRSCNRLRGDSSSTGKDRTYNRSPYITHFPYCALGHFPVKLTEFKCQIVRHGTGLHMQTFLSLCLLDISSHWCQMYSTSSLGKHHKSENGNQGRNFLVRWFYKYYLFFGYLCVGAEFTYVLAYVIRFTTDHWIHPVLKAVLLAVAPGCFLKQLVNAMQLTSACYAVAEYDAEVKNK